MAPKKIPDSQAVHFVRHLYVHAQTATGHSWTRLNGALHQAVVTAIKGGLEFGENDFSVFYREMNGGYWLGTPPDPIYAVACQYDNLSACKAFESCFEFSPYMLEGQRVYVGRDFTWDGKQVTCTSIAKDSLIACSYKPYEPGKSERKIDRRFTIKPADLAAYDKLLAKASADKKMDKARAEAERWAKAWGIHEKARALSVDDALIDKLSEYERDGAREMIKKRFKKVTPTLFDYLTVAFRYPKDRWLVERTVRVMAR